MYNKPDFYAEKARKMGYPARSVFKLEEIDTKYRICKPGRTILDIGAAPGSWSLYCFRKMKKKGLICAVDVQEITCAELVRAENVKIITGDATTPEIRQKIETYAPFDCIVSDAAPQTSGNRTVDSGRSYTLVSTIVAVFLPYLRKNGDFIAKMYQGGDEKELLNRLGTHFAKVKGVKPKASRDQSFEVFLLGLAKLSDASFA